MLTAIATLTDRQLSRTITSAHRSLSIHKASFLIHLAEFDERGLGGKAGTIAWVTRTQDISRRTAYEYLNVARRLRNFLQLTDRFSTGDLNYSQVRLLLPYLTADNETELVRLALDHTLSELETLLAGRPRTDGKKRRARNSMSVTVDQETGGVRFWGTFDPENGAEFLATLKAAELSQGTDSSTTRFGTPLATSMIGSFLSLLRLARTNPEAQTTAPGAQVNIIIDTDDNARLPGQPGAEGKELLRSIINGFLAVQIRGAGGRILNLGRTSRLVGRAQEKVLLTRWDHRCAAPGCDHTRWLEFHHILDWASGGATDLDNLIPLCSLHHTMVGNGELTIAPDPRDATLLRFRFPGGESFTSASNRQPVRDVHDDDQLPEHRENTDSFDDIIAGQTG
ncbi:HNH endonuclease signature motif containing protein [Corynebacterium sp.]|uniref:HNH endonuclease signature motif containing protein n=1 Tax=Corynebacterium sp. TaxID=1720 RepID=UPI0026DED4F7|nr:HNH endonuclease signature motif containing protein [Corynebacterium sp.]MDO5512074.1 HNH endonuclease signature motif containing protein [Corynebacterium sp.]